ncbi:MAG: helix-turn-helix transcriptional regulator [Anaerolineaceae bacterium]
MENKIESLRGQLGWTQQELADQVGVSRQTIISLENGRYNPSILLAFRLSKIFNLSIESIFLFKEEE